MSTHTVSFVRLSFVLLLTHLGACSLARKGLLEGALDGGADAGAITDSGANDSGATDSGAADTGVVVDAGAGCQIADDCNDGNPCTTETCENQTCVFDMPEGSSCDDGVYCNGEDVCSRGTCLHEDPPCPAPLCHEDEEQCDQCASSSDCGEPVLGDWSECGGYISTCDETGVQTRTSTSFMCNSEGECVGTDATIMQSCVRDTDGDSCQASEETNSRCTYSGTCAETGTREYDLRTYACENGTCDATTTAMTQPSHSSCNRDTDGNSCNDSNACTSNDECSGGSCSGETRDCDDDNACTVDSCSAGACENDPYPCTLGICIERCDTDDCEPICV